MLKVCGTLTAVSMFIDHQLWPVYMYFIVLLSLCVASKHSSFSVRNKVTMGNDTVYSHSSQRTFLKI
jgi:hypothetical protein